MATKIGQNFSLWSGDDRTVRITVRDSDNGAVKNLTSATISWKAARRVGATPVIEKTLGSGITVPAPASGVILIALEPADTADLRGEFVHETEVVDGEGKRQTVAVGRMTVKKDVIV